MNNKHCASTRCLALLMLITGPVCLWLGFEPYSDTARFAAIAVLGLEFVGAAMLAANEMGRVRYT